MRSSCTTIDFSKQGPLTWNRLLATLEEREDATAWVLHQLNIDPGKLEIILKIALQINGLREIHLRDNNLGNRGAKYILDFLANYPQMKIRVLDLSENAIDQIDAETLTRFFKQNKKLHSLNLSNNTLDIEKGTGETLEALFAALAHNQILQKLSLNSVKKLSNQTITCLIRCLQQNLMLQTIELQGHTLESITPENLEKLRRCRNSIRKIVFNRINEKRPSVYSSRPSLWVGPKYLPLDSDTKKTDCENNHPKTGKHV